MYHHLDMIIVSHLLITWISFLILSSTYNLSTSRFDPSEYAISLYFMMMIYFLYSATSSYALSALQLLKHELIYRLFFTHTQTFIRQLL